MKSIFTRIRWRLVGWTMLVLVLLLLVLGTAVYAAVARSLLDQVDRNLASRAEQAGAAFEAAERGSPGGREGYRGGVFYLLLDGQGRVLANPQRVNVDGLQLPTAGGRGGVYAVGQVDGDATRVLVQNVGRGAPPGTVLVVGQSLAPEEAALTSLLLVLVAGGGVGMLLSLAGAWFLAGRSLVPIEQAFRRQQEFVADASHELRTPLTVLRSATDLLNRHRDEPLAANGELFDDIRTEILRLERLTVDMLTLARSDRGELQLETAEVDLAALASEVCRLTGPLAHERGIALASKPERAAPAVEADPDRLQQVLLILLDNAIKHTPAGGTVSVLVRRQGSEALLEVVDTGTGIPPEHLPRVFDRFYRADAARSRSRGGTGLGLPIARTLVEAHGGILTLASTPGAGTRATIRLPCSGDAPPIEHPTDVQEAAERDAAGRAAVS